MTSTYTPAKEVSQALVEAFRTDPVWSDAGGLLFPAWSPSVDPLDLRVWSNRHTMPKHLPKVLEALPRVMFDVNWRPHTYEQEQAGTLHGPVSVWLHVVTPNDREEYGEMLVAQALLKLASTQLSGARIIAAELTATSDATKDRLSTFNGAWEWVVNLRSPNVGVLV